MKKIRIFLIVFSILIISTLITRFGTIHYVRGNFGDYEFIGKSVENIYHLLQFPSFYICYSFGMELRGGSLGYWLVLILNSIFLSILFTGFIIFFIKRQNNYKNY